MAKTSAHTRTYASVKAMANLAVHNTREWTEDHPAPRYLLPDEHHDPRGNVAIRRDLTPEQVIREYLETNRFGQKHGRLHHKAKPLRETVVVCEARHGREDMDRLMDELERELPFRCMYGHLHRDEGRIDQETGRPVFNYHMHIGHTNLVDGKLVDPGKAGLRKMQDICADVLGMERGTSVQDGEETRPHLTPREYRRMAREKERALAAERTQVSTAENTNRELTQDLAIRNQEYEVLKKTNRVLSDENARLTKSLRVSEETRAADEQTLERLKNDPDLDLKPGLDTIEDLAGKLVETNKRLRKQIQESGRGTPAIYKRLKEIKMSDQPITERLQAMTEYVDELLQDTPAPEPVPSHAPAPALADEFKVWLTDNQAISSNVVEVNRVLRQRLKDSGQARREDYMALKAIKEDPDLDGAARIVRMTEYVDERLAHQEPPAPEVLANTSRDVPGELRFINARPVLQPAAKVLIDERDLVAETARGLRKELATSKQAQTDAEARADTAENRVRELEEDLPPSGWVPPKVKARKTKSLLGKEGWEPTETAVEFRQRTLEAWRLSLDKQRRADREKLEEEKRKVREDARGKLALLGAFEKQFMRIWELPEKVLMDLAKEIGATITRFLDRLSRPAPEPMATRSQVREQDPEDREPGD